MTRLNLYQEYSGGEQKEPTNESSTISNDDVDNTEAPASVENVNVFTSDPSHPEDPRCNCTCIQGPPTQGCCNQERCECIDCFCFTCNCSAENALDVDNSLEQASATLPALPVGQGTLATLRRARENPLLARIAEQCGEDGLPVPIEEQLSQVARAPDNSRRLRRYTDPEDREPRAEWDDAGLMNSRRALSSARHHADLPEPAITPEPGNAPGPSNTSSDSILEALENVDNSVRLLQAALDRRDRRAGPANRPAQQQTQQQTQQGYPRGMAHLLEPQRTPQRRRSMGSSSPDFQPSTPCPIPEILDRSSVPLSEQSLAEVERAGLGDAQEESGRSADGEESDSGSSKTLSDNASEHRPEKRRRTSNFDETE